MNSMAMKLLNSNLVDEDTKKLALCEAFTETFKGFEMRYLLWVMDALTAEINRRKEE